MPARAQESDPARGVVRLTFRDRGRRRTRNPCRRLNAASSRWGWRATFYTTGMEHSPTSATGTGSERTPWHAVQGAARQALGKEGT
jgi:hypothetical protein